MTVISPTRWLQSEQSTETLSSDIGEFGHGGRPVVACQVAAGVASARPSRNVPRIVQESDIPWAVELASRRYPPEFNIEAAAIWVRAFVLTQPFQFQPIRTDDAFLVTMISLIPWAPSRWEANVVMCCAEDGRGWEVMALLRASVEWAKTRKCAEWKWRTGTEFDIGPLAHRMGARVTPPCYAVKLT